MARFMAVRVTRSVLNIALLAWAIAVALVVTTGSNPHTAIASPLQVHGALHRDDGVSIVSHRGAAAIAPENTLAAVRAATAQHVDFVEVDLRLTADGVPILMHDPTLSRTTNGTGKVELRTFEEIRNLDAGSWFGPEFAGEVVPTLDEFVVELTASPLGALIELKDEWSEEELVDLVEALRAKHLVNRVALQSFETETLDLLHEIAPEFARVMLTRQWNREVANHAVALQVSAVGARPEVFDESPKLTEWIRPLGIALIEYTLNDERTWESAEERGVDLVVTDDPVGLAEWQADAV